MAGHSQPTRQSGSARPASRHRNPLRSALLLIDEIPLKRAAWAELHAARKRQEKAARDLHRHEQNDAPAYDTWLHQTFPTLITLLRELHQEVFAKGQRVETVQAMAAMTGRSARKIWREQTEREKNPDWFESENENGAGARRRFGRDDPFKDDDFFRDEDDFSKDEGESAGRSGRWQNEPGPNRAKPSGPRPSVEARDVYRRLVQRLHPDRGGDWTTARQRLWHEVQLAWAAGDADWLMRLEVEWEAAHDVLSPHSPLSRLRCAIKEIDAARRDTEQKLRQYRGSPAWRFTLAVKKRQELHRRTERNFQHDIAFLKAQLDYLNATIARWEERPKSGRRNGARHFEVRFFE